MPFEIVTTECEKGILKGTNGFCPVAITEGTPKAAIGKLFKLAKQQADQVDSHRKNTRHFFAHFPLKLEEQKFHLLTRGTRAKNQDGSIGNLVVHQLLLSTKELANEGPAAMLANEKHWFTIWSAQPQILKPRSFEAFPLSPRICKLWKETTGDPGWAGTPIEAWLNEESCALIATPEVKSRTLIQMFSETQSLMPVEKRWKVPLSIGAWHPFGMDSRFWSAFDKGTQAEIDVMQHAATTRIDLSGDLTKASGKFSNAARLGAWVQLDSPNGTAPSESGAKLAEDELTLRQAETPAKPKFAPIVEAPAAGGVSLSDAGISSEELANGVSTFASRWLPNTAFGWVKAVAITVFAITMPALLWYGYKFSQDLINAAGDVDSPAILASRTGNSESESEEPTVDAEPAKDPEPVVPKVVKSPLTPVSIDELQASLSAIDENLIVDLPKASSEKTHLFTIEHPHADFDGQLFVSIDLLDKRAMFEDVEAKDTDPEQRWDLPMEIGGKKEPVASVIFERENGKFYWQWSKKELALNVVEDVLAGRILFAVEDAGSPVADFLLSRPTYADPISIFDLAKSPVLIEPHLSTLLTAEKNFRKNEWKVSNAKVLRQGETNSKLVKNSDFNVELRDKRIILRYDQQLIRNELNEWLGSKFADSIKNQAVLDELLEYHGPFGLSMLLNFKPSNVEQPGILLSSDTNVLIKGIDSDNSAIYIPKMKETSDPKSIKKFEGEIKRKVAIDVCEYLGITDPKIVEAIYRGRKKSSRDIKERIRLGMAGVVYKRVCSDIHSPIQLEITRRFRGFNREFTAIAMTWKPELVRGEENASAATIAVESE